MDKRKKRYSIIPQVALLFAVGILVTGVLTFFLQRANSNAEVKEQIESRASQIGEETMRAIREYPAYQWLIEYWYEHADYLDIEYDSDFGTGTETEEKCMLWTERHPDIQIKYATEQEIRTLSPEDRKLYTEIVYSWLITRLNQIKQAYDIDFLFCVVSDSSYTKQFFVLSAADQGAVRGSEYLQVYPLGVTVSVGESQQKAMRYARLYDNHLADAGSYVDYYKYLCMIGNRPVLIGLTYDLTDIRAAVKAETIRETTYAMLYQILLSLICLVLMIVIVLRPLKKVQETIRLYKETKDSASVVDELSEIRYRNEIGELAYDVADLSKEIDDYTCRIETITAEKERLGTEMELAARIQEHMLPGTFPPFPEHDEFDIYASMDPAREVGGDFYDFFLIDDDHLCLIMADVSGKGVPAALFMMASKIILENHANMGKEPEKILADVNRTICRNNLEEMFVTVWLGILEISTGRLTAANAGHEYPVLQQTGGKFEVYRDRHGFVIGGMDGMKYKQYEIMMEPDSRLFVYTDGVPEATDAEEKMFGMDRMLAALNQNTMAEPEEVLKNVRNSVDAFVLDAEQFDDLTMMCLHYKGKKRNPVKELTVEADAEHLSAVTAFVESALEEAGCPPKTQMEIDVAVDEIYSNIANYAYAPGSGSATIKMEFTDSPRAVIMTFTDSGIPYNPLEKEDPDTTLSADEREIGGLGIYIVKQIMDDVIYNRENGRNILKITKKY